jgi:hypothetical protein
MASSGVVELAGRRFTAVWKRSGGLWQIDAAANQTAKLPVLVAGDRCTLKVDGEQIEVEVMTAGRVGKVFRFVLLPLS